MSFGGGGGVALPAARFFGTSAPTSAARSGGDYEPRTRLLAALKSRDEKGCGMWALLPAAGGGLDGRDAHTRAASQAPCAARTTYTAVPCFHGEFR